MKKRIFTCTVLAAVLFAACSKEEGTATSGPRSVVIDPTLLEMSKTTRATDVDFETGDAIGLTIAMADGGAVYADNARFSYAGGKFVSDAGLLWYEDIGLKSNLVAYYPYAEVAPTEFTVKSDQSGDNYTLSDLMIAAKSDVTPTLDATNMTFRHQLTKLVVNINNQSGGEIAAVQVRKTVPTATVDLATQTVAVKAGAAAADIAAAEKIAGKQYFAIIVPQTVAPQLAVTIRTSGEEKTLTQTYKELDMLSGQYTIAVNVLADKIDVTVTGDIEDWDDNGSWEVDDQVPFEEFEDYFLYDGERYAIVSLADGNKWMAENLRYVPAGKRVSSDPADDADGIWYPAANAEKTADPSLVAKLGLLYDAGAAFGAEVTAENAYSFEGKQGICPKGWHIPTNAELTGLVGQNANSALTDTNAAYYDAAIKGASIAALNEAGFNWTFASVRNKASLTGAGSYLVTSYGDQYGVMSYVWGSTCSLVKETNGAVTNMQYYAFMSTYNASNEKVAVAYGNVKSGYSVRCVKNK
ncbi:MAG: fimbrillin family protein [Alistipes sp.]|nr:fimbrillin family protein [Alistipes sp.]